MHPFSTPESIGGGGVGGGGGVKEKVHWEGMG